MELHVTPHICLLFLLVLADVGKLGVLGHGCNPNGWPSETVCTSNCTGAGEVCVLQAGMWHCVTECGNLTAPVNGNVNTSTGITHESIAVYSCDAGYNLVGACQTVCLSSGLWSSSPPACVPVDCGPLDPPLNCEIWWSSTEFNETTSYSCDTGFNLTGTDVRTCLASGCWSGSAPTCTIVDCGIPMGPSGSGSVHTFATTYNSVATYSCDFKFYLSSCSTSRTCQANGLWDGTTPVCSKIFCGGSSTNPNLIGTPTCIWPEVECKVVYTCSPGYTLVGASELVCLSTGQWSADFPMCSPVDCGPLDAPLNGEIWWSSTEFNETTGYSCYTGFNLTGTDVRTCLASGFWSGIAPTCEPVPPV